MNAPEQASAVFSADRPILSGMNASPATPTSEPALKAKNPKNNIK